MSRSIRILLGLIVFSTMSPIAIAEEGDPTVGNAQSWSITFADNSAVIRTSASTDGGAIQQVIQALKQDGIEKIALRVSPTEQLASHTAERNGNPTIAITYVDKTAKIAASRDLPYKYVVSTISMLTNRGVERMRFSSAKVISTK